MRHITPFLIGLACVAAPGFAGPAPAPATFAAAVELDPAGGVTGPDGQAVLRLSLPETARRGASLAWRRNGKEEISRQDLTLDASGGAEVRLRLDQPGAVLGIVTHPEGKGQPVARAGFIHQPERIGPAVARPADFDAFWDAKLAELARVPIDPVLSPGKFSAPVPGGVVYTQFSLAVSATGRVRGQLAHPDRPGKKFPALVIFQWAGVYPLQPGTVTGNAAQGWLAVNVFAHDQPVDESKEFYDELAKGALKDYGAIGADDREKSYFLRMYLGARRALDFVRLHPAWDGRVLVAHGTSQGGSQAIVAAALDPSVTAVVANVPALCDQNGPEAGRAMPYPYWLAKTAGRDPAAVASAARYYDVAHFAPRVRAPVLVSAGLIDETCPPAGVAAMANALAGPRELLFMPQANHQGANNTHAPYAARSKAWLEALRRGEPAPLAR